MSYRRYGLYGSEGGIEDETEDFDDFDNIGELEEGPYGDGDFSGWMNSPPPSIKDRIVEDAFDEPPVKPNVTVRPRGVGYTIPNPVFEEPEVPRARDAFKPVYAHEDSWPDKRVVAGAKLTGATLAATSAVWCTKGMLTNSPSPIMSKVGILGFGMYLHPTIGWRHGAASHFISGIDGFMRMGAQYVLLPAVHLGGLAGMIYLARGSGGDA
mgnify:FL=1|tara:strand:+ start:621 stop:1253 length:633 start_codon:yes stop_codon:yes gene_type:complete